MLSQDVIIGWRRRHSRGFLFLTILPPQFSDALWEFGAADTWDADDSWCRQDEGSGGLNVLPLLLPAAQLGWESLPVCFLVFFRSCWCCYKEKEKEISTLLNPRRNFALKLSRSGVRYSQSVAINPSLGLSWCRHADFARSKDSAISEISF